MCQKYYLTSRKTKICLHLPVRCCVKTTYHYQTKPKIMRFSSLAFQQIFLEKTLLVRRCFLFSLPSWPCPASARGKGVQNAKSWYFMNIDIFPSLSHGGADNGLSRLVWEEDKFHLLTEVLYMSVCGIPPSRFLGVFVMSTMCFCMHIWEILDMYWMLSQHCWPFDFPQNKFKFF